ncbi:MAG: aminotransferase class V-fold PLP-dependent enzyme [Burkholderiales bacterium]|nr:aminotransferase class V-fold PLP-dependent enzyme [Burkholderiales bacterium]
MRELFLLDPDLAFLNHGSFGACPRAVLDALAHWQREQERNPVEFLGRRAMGLLANARSALGAAIGARGDDLVFMPNSTTGVNVVAQSFPLQAGDEVLSTDLEYGACDAAWRRACERQGAQYRRVEIPLPFRPAQMLERLVAAITPRTRLIFLSHITSTTALTLPVASVCAAARERGVAVLVDGAHAPGQIPLDLAAIGADFYVGNCHKWQCAPKGSAFLHARPDRQAGLHAPVISWGYAADVGCDAALDAWLGQAPLERRMQWQGTRDITPWLTVPDALDFQQAHGWPAVRARSHALVAQALDALTRRHRLAPIAADGDWAQMAAIPVPPQDAGRLQRRLFDESRIEVPVTSHAGRTFVRVSAQGYTTEADIDRLLNAPALR